MSEPGGDSEAWRRDWRAIAVVAFLLLAEIVVGYMDRTQVSLDDLDGRFTGNDAYLYYRQAQRIVEEGGLPERDMERWLPLGRDLAYHHNLYSYVLAYSYKTARIFHRDLTLYSVACYAPPVLFVLTALLFAAAIWTCIGMEYALFAGLLFVFSPSIANRTAVGFGDRDAFCLFLGVLMGALYLWQLKSSGQRRRRLVLAGAAGLTAVVGCLAWEGFGLFVLCALIPMAAAGWRDKERAMDLYIFSSCLSLLLFSKAHQVWNFPSEPAHPVGWLVLFPALLAEGIVLTRWVLQLFDDFNPFDASIRWLACIPAVLCCSLGVFMAVRVGAGALDYAVPLSGSRLMQTISELQGMDLERWTRRFGLFQLVLAAAGVAGFGVCIARKRLHNPPGGAWEPYLFGALWLLVWASFAHGAKRYAMMAAPALAAWSALAMVGAAKAAVRQSRPAWMETAAAVVLLATAPFAMLYWEPAGALSMRTHRYATGRTPRPDDNTLAAMRWMRTGLDRSAGRPVAAAWWTIGSQLNVLADASTLVDQDLWKHYWIHLHARHLYCAENEEEALRFLKTRGADCWLLTEGDIQAARTIGRLGSAIELERDIGFARSVWAGEVSSFEPVYDRAGVKIFRIHYPSDLIVPAEMEAAWTAPDFTDSALRRAWMRGE